MNKIVTFYLELIRSNKEWFFLIAAIFLTGFIFGISISLINPQITQRILANYAASIDQNLETGADLANYILIRNATIVFISTFGGLLFGLLPAFTSFINGLLLGALTGYPQVYHVLNPFQFILLILPHGIFEYLGSFLALGFGLKLGINWFSSPSKGKRFRVLLQSLRETLVIIPLVLVLLIIAAFIEGNLTAEIACFVAGVCQ